MEWKYGQLGQQQSSELQQACELLLSIPIPLDDQNSLLRQA